MIGAMILGAVLLLAACGGGGSASDSKAEALYQAKCANCHGKDLEGGISVPMINIGSQMSVKEIEEVTIDGIGTMPGKLLIGDDAKAVAKWLGQFK